MSEITREEGLWWLPRSPKSSRSSGTLVVDEEGVRLESVIGPLADIPRETLCGPDVIFGRSTKGTIYTCLQTFCTKRTTSTAAGESLEIVELDVVNLWRGRHFKKAEEAIFKEGAWRYSNLHFWIHNAPAISLQETKDKSYIVKSLRERAGLWEAVIDGGITISNDFSFSHSWKSDPPAIDFMHYDGVRVRSPKPLLSTLHHKLESRFRALVNLLADCQLEIIDETFRTDPNGFGEAKQLGRRWAGGYAKRDDPRNGREAVSFSEIQDFGNVIETWFSEYEKLGPIANLYLHGKHNAFLDNENQFLGIMQAIEAFHRKFHPGVFMPEKEYAKVASIIGSAVPETVTGDFRDRLKSAIKYGYEFSLARRLNELVKLLPPDGVFEKVRDKAFRRKSIESRNAFTHQIRDPAKPPMKGRDLYDATLGWRAALLALILQRLGIPEKTVVTAAKRLQARGGTYVTL